MIHKGTVLALCTWTKDTLFDCKSFKNIKNAFHSTQKKRKSKEGTVKDDIYCFLNLNWGVKGSELLRVYFIVAIYLFREKAVYMYFQNLSITLILVIWHFSENVFIKMQTNAWRSNWFLFRNRWLISFITIVKNVYYNSSIKCDCVFVGG